MRPVLLKKGGVKLQVTKVERCKLNPGLKAPPGFTKFDCEKKDVTVLFNLKPGFI